MKNFTQLAVIAIMGISLASCDKKTTTTTPTTTTPTTTAGPTAASPTPSGSDISGALISLKMTYSSQPTGSPIPIELETEIGSAVFYSAPGSTTLVDGGAVTVNTIALDKATNNAYSKLASVGLTPSTMNFDNGSDWSVAGNGSVTGFTYTHSTSFPNYNGTVPTSVTKANGISLSFTTSNLSAADSVYVLVAAGNVSVLKAFSATAGSITISAADLSALPVVTDNTAIFEICPFKYNIVNKNSKKYVFVKEQALVKNININ